MNLRIAHFAAAAALCLSACSRPSADTVLKTEDAPVQAVPTLPAPSFSVLAEYFRGELQKDYGFSFIGTPITVCEPGNSPYPILLARYRDDKTGVEFNALAEWIDPPADAPSNVLLNHVDAFSNPLADVAQTSHAKLTDFPDGEKDKFREATAPIFHIAEALCNKVDPKIPQGTFIAPRTVPSNNL